MANKDLPIIDWTLYNRWVKRYDIIGYLTCFITRFSTNSQVSIANTQFSLAIAELLFADGKKPMKIFLLTKLTNYKTRSVWSVVTTVDLSSNNGAEIRRNMQMTETFTRSMGLKIV